MGRQQNSSTRQSITVDVRLCGSIPRKDMASSSTSLIGALTTPGCSLPLCSRGTRTNEESSHLSQTVALPSLVLQNKSNISNLPRYLQQPHNVIEPPQWAVPARGETSLEVRIHVSLLRID